MIDRLRYFLGVYCAILVPLGVLFWFVIHPWARWWRRLGPTRTYLIVLPPLVVCAVLLFRVRVWLLGSNLGTNWILIGVAIFLLVVTLWLEPKYWKQLNIATLVGVPELSLTVQRRGKLLREGVYSTAGSSPRPRRPSSRCAPSSPGLHASSRSSTASRARRWCAGPRPQVLGRPAPG